jgi:hypothetical protein
MAPDTVLPDFIQPIPEHLAPEDIEFLRQKGCFQIPSPELRDAILRSYAEYVHPCMPVLDLARFLSGILSPKAHGGRISLLLFQAVMFAGSAHVEIKRLRKLGYLKRKAARRALLIKVKTLYDMEYEANRLAVAQALTVSLALWIETPDDQKNACHWIQIAWSLGRRAGIDQDPAKMSMPESERRLRRRLYWSMLNRDALCALGLKAPLSCWPVNDEMPDLDETDFDLGDVPQDGYEKIGVQWPPNKRPLLCQAAVAQAKLHGVLRNIMSQNYQMGEYKREARKLNDASSKMVLLPLTTPASRANLEKLESALKSWLACLPPDLQQTTVETDVLEPFESYVVIRSVLHMLYNTCLITLYRPWVRPLALGPGQENGKERVFQQKVQKTVRDSAYAITELGVGLHQLDLVRQLPQTALSAMVAAVVSHISDMLSPSEQIRRAGLQGFERCSHLVEELRDNYYSADHSADFVRILANVKQSSRKPRQTQEESHPVLEGEMLETHVDALAGFSAVPYDPTENVGIRESPPPLTRSLPHALFQENLRISDSSDGGAPQTWDLQIGSIEDDGNEQTCISASADWEYYRNFREETVRLLGDFYDDPSGIFSALPELQSLPI